MVFLFIDTDSVSELSVLSLKEHIFSQDSEHNLSGVPLKGNENAFYNNKKSKSRFGLINWIYGPTENFIHFKNENLIDLILFTCFWKLVESSFRKTHLANFSRELSSKSLSAWKWLAKNKTTYR